MAAAQPLPLMTVDDYLAAERVAEVRHEYLGGRVFAMAGATNRHNRIAANFVIAVGGRLRGKPCGAFGSDVKVRIDLARHSRFYYPDATVVCEPNDEADSFQDRPVVVLEVLSPPTRRTDEGEKLEAYLSLPSVRVVVLAEADEQRVVVYRRAGTSVAVTTELYVDPNAVVPLPEVDAELPLAELYERVLDA